MDDATDDELARRAAAGDKHALDELLRRIRPAVLSRCAKMLQYWADAEEACQDALWAVAKDITTFEGRSKFSTWLYRVVVNSLRQTYTKLKRKSLEHPTEELPQRPDPRTTSVIAGSRIDLLEALDKLERRSPELTAPFVLRDLADWQYNDIAEQLRLPLSTIKFRIHEARNAIKRHMKETS
ncbi:RNA polymerase sigma-70 factor (ECF subfamily) [Herbihabitans rhizosphaerae]|uniref:RNA polymerase sigma-70 factor (ECF subfamily) n=1 Tax=Herbihabitans rhizosphaerae TaxID=1872711 RepID=A0A4Q7L4R0_9PSEU|nr:RNA polymerase sigma-70 factor (ECF subfamily) [Herbihabitans rhizosphaerae]